MHTCSRSKRAEIHGKLATLGATLDRFDEPFSPIVAPYELSVVEQLPIWYIPYTKLTISLAPYDAASQYVASSRKRSAFFPFSRFSYLDGLLRESSSSENFVETFRESYTRLYRA